MSPVVSQSIGNLEQLKQISPFLSPKTIEFNTQARATQNYKANGNTMMVNKGTSKMSGH